MSRRWLLVVSLVAFLWLWLLGSRLISVTPDSIVYIATAENLAAGEGLTVPFQGITADRIELPPRPSRRAEPATHYPPLFPLLIAATLPTGLAPETGARLVLALAGAASAGVFVHLSRNRLQHSLRTTLTLAVLLLAGFDFLEPHLAIYSEPLLMLACLAAIVALTSTARAALVGAGVAGAAAVMSRYIGAGVSLAVAGLAVSRGWRRAAPSIVPMFAVAVVWGAFLVTSGTGRRAVGWHPPSASELGLAGRTVGGWVLPARLPDLVLLVLGSSFVLLVVVVALRTGGANHVVALTGLALVVVVLVAKSAVQDDAPLDRRFLSPLFALFLLLLGSAFEAVRRERPRSAMLLLAVPLASTAGGFASWVIAEEVEGDWVRTTPTNIEVSRHLRRVDPDRFILSDDPGRVYYLADRPAYLLPPEIDLGTGARDPGRAAYLEDVRSLLGQGAAEVVIFAAEDRDLWERELHLGDPVNLEGAVVYR